MLQAVIKTIEKHKSLLGMLLFNVAGTGFSLLKQISLATVLPVASYGTYVYYSIVINYSNYADFGSNNAKLVRSTKYIREKKDFDLERLSDTIDAFTLLLLCSYILISIAIPFLIGVDENDFKVLQLFLISSAANMLFNLMVVEQRLLEKYVFISILQAVSPLICLGFFYILDFGFDIHEPLVYAYSNVISVVMICLILLKHTNVFTRVREKIESFSFSVWRDLFYGITITIIPVLYLTFQSLDRIILIDYLPAYTFGCYSLGTIIGQYFSVVPSTIAMKHSTRTMTMEKGFFAFDSVLSPVYLASSLSALFLLIFALFGKSVFEIYFASYYSEFWLVYKMVASNSLLFPVVILAPFMIANVRASRLIFFYLVACGAYFFTLVLAKRTDNLFFITSVCAIANFFFAAIFIYILTKTCQRSMKDFLLTLMKSYALPALVLILVVVFNGVKLS